MSFKRNLFDPEDSCDNHQHNCCKKEPCCSCCHKQERCLREHCKHVVGVVTSSSLVDLAVTGTPIPLPLTAPILVTECVRISPTGGLIVQEAGDYLIQFTASVLVVSATGGLSVYADSRFLGNAGPLSALGLANFAQIVRLKEGDLIQVVAEGPIAAGVLGQGTLTVARLG